MQTSYANLELQLLMFLSTIKKNLLPLTSLVFLIFLVIWLWQRQPSLQKEEILSQKSQSEENQNPQDEKKAGEFPNNIVSNQENIQIKGKTKPKEFIVITTNSFFLIAPADNNGNFDANVKLAGGLNLIDFLTISKDLKNIQEKSLTFYFDKSQKSKIVYAGSVKNIFDTLLTISTPEGDLSVHSTQDTQFDIPKLEDNNENPATSLSPLKDIRVGDFAVSLGNLAENNTQIAQTIIIFRTDKPQNLSQVITAQIAQSPKNNFFTVKNLKDSKIVELNLTSSSQIQTENAAPSTAPKAQAKSQILNIAEIVKDKNAIIIYHIDQEKLIVDRMLLLP